MSILLGCIYKSPSGNEEESTDQLTKMLSNIENTSHDKVIITGDFNYPNINWASGLPDPNCTSKFTECLQDLFFYLKSLLSQLDIE